MTENSESSSPTGIYKPLGLGNQKVIVGAGGLENLGDEVDALGGKRVLVITSPSIVNTTPLLKQIENSLGKRLGAVFDGVVPHSPIPTILEAAAKARETSADCLVSIGGGSSLDTAKALAVVLDLGITDISGLEPYLGQFSGGKFPQMPTLSRPLPHIAIPTTGCAAEYSGIAGVTDPVRNKKYLIVAPPISPSVAILDPMAVKHTPHKLWLSTLVRSVDHAIEASYSTQGNPHTQILADEAARLLFKYLPRCHTAPDDLEARGWLQVAAWHSGWAALGASAGLSHGIGYVLGGSFDIPHGICSCVMLPTVMEWNMSASIDPLARIARVIGAANKDDSNEVAASNCAVAVRSLITDLDLPTRLGELDELDKEDLRVVADLTMDLPHLQTNPRPVHGKHEILELLDLAW